MLTSEIRAEARKRLTGKWGKAAILGLAFFLISFVLGFVEGIFPKNIQWIPSLVVAILEIPLAYGLLIEYLKLYNGEDIKYFDFLSQGFNNFARSWKVTLWIVVKMLIPVILLVVAVVLMAFGVAGSIVNNVANSSSGGFGILSVIAIILYIVSIVWLIIKSYAYQLSQLVAIENPNMLAKEAVEKSEELMKGRKGKLFFLQLSFIGWAILCGFTFGIGMLWLLPYIQISTIVFYKDASGNAKPQENITNE